MGGRNCVQRSGQVKRIYAECGSARRSETQATTSGAPECVQQIGQVKRVFHTRQRDVSVTPTVTPKSRKAGDAGYLCPLSI
jgi:hypothetical protein